MQPVAVNLDEGIVIVDTGGQFPISKFLDADGEECDEEHAIMAIAGFDYTWFWVDLREFDGRRQ